MPVSFMEIICIDSDGDGRMTDMSHAANTDAETWAAFRSYRRFGVEFGQAKFLLDYHNRRGDLADTIAIDETGFIAITGHQPKSEAAYRKIDADYWREARKRHEAKKAA